MVQYLVKLPQSDQLVDDGLLLRDAAQLGHEARVLDHAEDVEVGREPEENGKEHVEQQMAVSWVLKVLLVQAAGEARARDDCLPAFSTVPGKSVNSQLTPTQKRDAPKMPDIHG